MNPHADSVQQPSDASLTLTELADKCGATNAYTNSPKIGFSPEAWMRFDNALRAIRFGTRPAAEPCKGTNCTTTDGVNHSQECRDEHDAVVTAAANADRPLFDPNFPSQGYVTDAEWAARKARAAEPSQSGSAGEAGQPFYDLAWQYGATQHTSFAGDELEGLTFTPNDFEAFCAALSRQAPAAPTQALLGWTRYEKARKLNPAQWAELHQRNLRGGNFDDMIDALPATTQPVQQDTRPPMQTWWFKELQEFWESSDSYITAAIKSAMDHIRTAPPAEKQAAPSGVAGQAVGAPISDERAHEILRKAAKQTDDWAERLNTEPTEAQCSGKELAYILKAIAPQPEPMDTTLEALRRLERAVDLHLGRSSWTQTTNLKGLGYSEQVRKELYAAHDEARAALAASQAERTAVKEKP